jgi:acetoin utilization protein AcuB
MLVKDRMSVELLTVGENESVPQTHRIMLEQNVRHLPVVDKRGTMVGLVTEEDLVKAEPSAATLLSVWEIHSLLDKLKVKDVMVREVITTTEDTPIEEAAELLLEHKIGCLPVLREGRLVGIITESDIFRTFMDLFSAQQKGLRLTLEVPDQEGELAKIAQAIADQGGYIASCGTFAVKDPSKWGVVLKVKNVDRATLSETLSRIEGESIRDIREV